MPLRVHALHFNSMVFFFSTKLLLCKRVQASGARCFLHFGEFFASTDLLNSNLFFTLAKSPYVDELIMDSNMALLGAASSPSVVGLLVWGFPVLF